MGYPPEQQQPPQFSNYYGDPNQFQQQYPNQPPDPYQTNGGNLPQFSQQFNAAAAMGST
jgi:hypothetical protein